MTVYEKRYSSKKVSNGEFEELKKEMMEQIDHELRTPLSVIKAGMEFLENNMGRQYSDTEERVIKLIRGNIERLCDIVDTIHLYLELDSGFYLKEKECWNLIEVVNRTYGKLSPLFSKRKLKWEFITTRNDIWIHSDSYFIKIIELIIQKAVSISKDGSFISVEIIPYSYNNNNSPAYEHLEISIRCCHNETFARQLSLFGNDVSVPSKRGYDLKLDIASKVINSHNGYFFISDIDIYTEFIIQIPTFCQ